MLRIPRPVDRTATRSTTVAAPRTGRTATRPRTGRPVTSPFIMDCGCFSCFEEGNRYKCTCCSDRVREFPVSRRVVDTVGCCSCLSGTGTGVGCGIAACVSALGGCEICLGITICAICLLFLLPVFIVGLLISAI